MTRTTPLRRMILQLRQIFFTDANTFIAVSPSIVAHQRAPLKSSLLPNPACRSRHHLARKMIRARDRSYGVRSTVTLSPGKIFM
jgi:hypothetical protein